MSAIFTSFTPTHAYILAALIGAAIGLGEILSRYRDAPFLAARTGAGMAYILFNAFVAVVAMVFVHQLFPMWSASADVAAAPAPTAGQLVRDALVSGFGAMAVLRSSVLTTRAGGKDVEIGPAAVIDIFRSAMDRSIARVRASSRATEVVAIMDRIRFDRSNASLASIAMALLQSVDAEERDDVEQRIAALANQTGRSDRDKALELGLIIAGSLGFPALRASIEALGDRVSNAERRPEFVVAQMSRLPLQEALRDLPATCLALNVDVSPEDQKSLAAQIDGIAGSAMSDHAKRVNVGLIIVALLGEENLKSGVDMLAGAVGGKAAGAAAGGTAGADAAAAGTGPKTFVPPKPE